MQIIQNKPPQCIYIETYTNPKNKRGRTQMPFEKYQYIIDQIISIKTKRIKLFFNTDSFKNKDSLYLIGYAKNHNLNIDVQTRLKALHEKEICSLNALLDNGDNVYINLEYNILDNSDIKTASKYYHYLKRENERKINKCNIFINTDNKEIMKDKERQDIYNKIISESNSKLNIEQVNQKMIMGDKLIPISHNISLIKFENKCNKYCAWHQLVVLINGDIVFCNMDYQGQMVVGNVFETNLINIWNGKGITQWRKKINGEYKCLDCLPS